MRFCDTPQRREEPKDSAFLEMEKMEMEEMERERERERERAREREEEIGKGAF